MNVERIIRLIRLARKKLHLDLSGLTVYTEAASGYFSLTPLIASLAGAKEVFAVGKNSEYGRVSDVEQSIKKLASVMGCLGNIHIVREKRPDQVAKADVVTNLGFVRPIDATMISWMKPTASVPLMWEPWEYRPEDVDLVACEKKGIPVLGTNESSQDLRTYEFVGLLVLKLLFETDIEILLSRILVLGGGPFGRWTVEMLDRIGATVAWLNPDGRFPAGDDFTVENVPSWTDFEKNTCLDFLAAADALVLVEHHFRKKLLGPGGMLTITELTKLNKGITVIHLCGEIDMEGLKASGLPYRPEVIKTGGYMSLSTAYLGPRPLIDLHTAGLRVGEVLARARLEGDSVDQAKKKAIRLALGKDFSQH